MTENLTLNAVAHSKNACRNISGRTTLPWTVYVKFTNMKSCDVNYEKRNVNKMK